MDHSHRFTLPKLKTRLKLVETHRFQVLTPILSYECQLVEAPEPDLKQLRTVATYEVRSGDYWIGQQQNFVLTTSINCTEASAVDNVALYLPLGNVGDIFNHPEALIRINRELIGSADRYHHLIPLKKEHLQTDHIIVTLQGWSGLTGWPIDDSNPAELQMGDCALVKRFEDLDEFIVWASVALQTVDRIGAKDPAYSPLLHALDEAFSLVRSDEVAQDTWFASFTQALQHLQTSIKQIGAPLPIKLHALGHAHIDIAYLWPMSQTRLKNARTISNQLALMEAYPEFQFSHSQPAMYYAVANDYPDLFKKIQQRVAEERWELLGGTWVEPDFNIPGSESLVRQFLLARQYYDTAFNGLDTRVLWAPDSFGFPWSLPQLIKQAGIEVFITSKLNWNQTNQIPASTHRWRGIDGTEVLTHVLTTPRPVEHLPFPTNYKSDLSVDEVIGTWEDAVAPERLKELPICYGYGDGGGGPTEALVKTVQAFAHMPAMPKLEFSTAKKYYHYLTTQADDLTVWNDEHYLEGHRGTYTSQAWIKRANRHLENQLHYLESLCVLLNTSINTKHFWQQLCLYQFHDLLPGTSVSEAFVDAKKDLNKLQLQLEHAIQKVLQNARGALEQSVNLQQSTGTLCVVNVTPYGGWQYIRLKPVQVANLPTYSSTLQTDDDGECWLLSNCPSYCMQSLHNAVVLNNSDQEALAVEQGPTCLTVTNHWWHVDINASGQIASLIDRQTDRQVIEPGCVGNQIQVFEDRPLVWEAWDIEPYFEDRQVNLNTECDVNLLAAGPLFVAVQVVRKYRGSTVTQLIKVHRHTRRIDFETVVDWQEKNHLVKVCFPVSVYNRRALYEIQWGHIDRPTHRNTSWDKARFEVPAQRWACLNEPGLSVALLNDCKYGYDIHDNQMRLTLIKTSNFPDNKADIGMHQFTYSLYADVEHSIPAIIQQAWEINHPLQLEYFDIPNIETAAPLVTTDNANIIIQTIKPPEITRVTENPVNQKATPANAVHQDTPDSTPSSAPHQEDSHHDGFVIRLYECEGRRGTVSLTFSRPVSHVFKSDILESVEHPLQVSSGCVQFDATPFEVVTLICK